MSTLQFKIYRVELEIMLRYRGGHVHYRLHEEAERIFTAYMVSFDGNSTNSPAEEITLVKGVRNWTGSVEDDLLLQELGKFIDTCWHQNQGSNPVI